jgi:hypothetical protein
MEVSGARWVLAERPPDGRTLCVAAGSKDGTLSARPTGFPACTASLVASLSRAGGGGGAAVCWIVPCADLAEARQWSVLAGLPGRQ